MFMGTLWVGLSSLIVVSGDNVTNHTSCSYCRFIFLYCYLPSIFVVSCGV
ncbi:hypothetical protein BC941DRAFT_437491 [Chlamydoabsidia padenii]|nr:hypothetical protein BC941DRAFT_437491 [Chlamydoabsidia padenii]